MALALVLAWCLAGVRTFRFANAPEADKAARVAAGRRQVRW
jgi:hypothetical protein